MAFQAMQMSPYHYSFIGYVKSLICNTINNSDTILSDDQIDHSIRIFLSRTHTSHLFQGGIEAGFEETLRDMLITHITTAVMKDLIPTLNAADEIYVDEQIYAEESAPVVSKEEPAPVVPKEEPAPVTTPVKKSISWAEQMDKEDAEEAERDALKMKLQWAQRVAVADKTIEQLRAQVDEQENAEKKSNSAIKTEEFPIVTDAIVTPTKKEMRISNVSKKQKPVEMYNTSFGVRKPVKMFSVPPKRPTDQDDGWKVAGKEVKKSMFSGAEVEAKLTFENKKPGKKYTSAKWFFPETPIVDEEHDFFLWDYDEEGIPYGWYQISDNKWKITSGSQFIHTRHSDKPNEFPLGYWTHDEYFQVTDEKTGRTLEKVRPVSVSYLTYCLTPTPLRRGSCPAY